MKVRLVVLVALTVLVGCAGKTVPPDRITDTTARLKAEGSCEGNPSCSYKFKWGLHATPPVLDHESTPVTGIGDTNGTVPFSTTVTGLQQNASYDYQVCGKGDGITDWQCVGPNGAPTGSVETFQTPYFAREVFTGAGAGTAEHPQDPVGSSSEYCETHFDCEYRVDPGDEPAPALTSYTPAQQITEIPASAGGGYLLAPGNSPHGARILKISSLASWPTGGVVTTVAGADTNHYNGNERAAVGAFLYAPQEAAGLSNGGFLIADWGNNQVRYVDSGGQIHRAAGLEVTGPIAYFGVGHYGNACTLPDPTDPPDGPNFGNPTVPYSDASCGVGGPATDAALYNPDGVTPIPGTVSPSNPTGDYLITEGKLGRITYVHDGILTRIAGTGVGGFSGDGGPADQAKTRAAGGTQLLPDGSFVISDGLNCRIRRVSHLPTGPSDHPTIETIAGSSPVPASGEIPFLDACFNAAEATPTGDGGDAQSAYLRGVNYLAVTAGGGIFATEIGKYAQPGLVGRIRYIAPPDASGTRVISAVFNQSAAFGFDGDERRPALTAKGSFPSGIVSTRRNTVFGEISGFAFTDNNRIRYVEVPSITPYHGG